MTFDPPQGFLRATAAVTLRAAESAEAIEFEMNPRLTIRTITDAGGRALEWQRSQRIGSPKLLVRLPAPAPGSDAALTLTFVYDGAPLLRGLDSITPQGILLRDEAGWYPAVDAAAFTFHDITIRVPPGWRAFTSGEAQEDAHRFKSDGAVSSRSVVAFPAAGRSCDEPSRAAGEAPAEPRAEVRDCLGRARREAAAQLRARAAAAAAYYARLVGRNTPLRLTILPGFHGQGGAFGYSAPGLLVVSEDVVKFARDPDYLPEFLPHEMAHQWFPIEVTAERAEDGWLGESLAEYLAWRWLQQDQPERARAMVARAMRDALAPEPLPPLGEGLRMFARYDWGVTYASLYQRGMLVWRTLEAVVGRARVDAALREYYRRFAGRAASAADFRKVCEEISGRDLGWFFDYFLSGVRIPELELRRVPAGAPGEYAGELVVAQVPAEFSVRVEMKLHTAEGVVAHSVATRGGVTPFTVNVPGIVTRVVLDPEARILRWTEAARRNRAQRALLAALADAEEAGRFAEAIEAGRRALALDPDDAARNAQLLHFQIGRIYLRRGMAGRAQEAFGRVFQTRSEEASADAFYRAWARVFRARIARGAGRAAPARTEAAEGLRLAPHALETPIRWPGTAGEETARAALAALARPAAATKKTP